MRNTPDRKTGSSRSARVGLLLLSLLLCACQAIAGDGHRSVSSPHNVLFVGNSFTYFNNSLSSHVRDLARAADPASMENRMFKVMTISGEELETHEPGLMNLLGRYDFEAVVIQGHSLEAFDEDRRPGLEETARHYAALIRAEGASPVLFMTWAYRDRPEMTPVIASAYTQIGETLDITVAPVGLAFADAIETIPGVSLHHPDGLHPSMEGTYLAACVFYGVLFGHSPEGLEYTAGLDDERALALQRSAWRTVSAYGTGP